MIAVVIPVYILLILYEFIPLFKQKLWKDFYVNAVLALCSLTVIILICFDIDIPSPAKPIKAFITSIFGK